jgi:hypothetical protein
MQTGAYHPCEASCLVVTIPLPNDDLSGSLRTRASRGPESERGPGLGSALLKLADFLEKGTARSTQFFRVLLHARQDAHIALLESSLAKPVHIRLAGSIPSLPNVILCMAKRGDCHGKER